MTARPEPSYFALCAEWDTLAKFMTMNRPTPLPMHCEGDDYRTFAEDLAAFARQVDRLVLAHGEHLDANSPVTVELKLFTNQLTDALEGNALYEVSQCEEAADEEMTSIDPDDLYDQWRDRKMEDAS